MPPAHDTSRAPGAGATPGLGVRGVARNPVDAPPPDPASEARLRPGGGRPRMQLVRRAAGVADGTPPAIVHASAAAACTSAEASAPAPALGVTSAPVAPASSTAQALARATAGTIAYEDDGRMSVLFPPPGAVTAPAVPVLARDDAEAPAPALAPAVTAEAAPPAAPAAAPALDREDLYQDFMRRLRRDVLEQREQIGELY
jgi:hypothetical protein